MNGHTRLFTLLTVATVMMAGCAGGEEGKKDFTDTMAHEHAGDHPVGNDVAWMEPSSPVKGEEVSYGTNHTAYLALPEGNEKPTSGLIVIHEWWGLNDNIQAMARRLAGEGYMALAVDLYNGNVATTPDSAKSFMGTAMKNPDVGIGNLREALTYLKEQGATKVGVIGWCFGGGWSLRTALNFPEEIAATVIYYGQLETDPEQLKKLKMPVLGMFGEEDQGIPVEQVKQFEQVLDSIGVDASINIYPNANHAFANPSGERYNEEAAKDAWEKTVAFLKGNL